MNFWRWFFIGLNHNSGISKFLDEWLIVQIIISISLTELVTEPIEKIATTFLLPLAGIFTGLAFALSSNTQSLLESKEIERLSKEHKDGIENYLYTYQVGILTIFITLIGWGLASLKIFEKEFFSELYLSIKFLLFLFAVISLRECWNILNYNHSMLHTKIIIRKLENDS